MTPKVSAPKSADQHLVCVVCPIGCNIAVQEAAPGEEPTISGFRCRRGLEYARTEIRDPRRVLTATVTAVGGDLRRLPVKTSGTIPKRLLLEAAEILRQLTVAPPIAAGEVVLPNLLGSGVHVIATRDLRSERKVGDVETARRPQTCS